MSASPRRPRLALPFTILTERDTVRLVAGEDFRYTLTAPGLEAWLPAWLTGLDGSTRLEEAVACLASDHRGAAKEIAQRLYGERVLIDGTAADAHVPVSVGLKAEGEAAWAKDWSPRPPGAGSTVPVLCQDRLDYDEALRFNRRRRAEGRPWFWASTGALSRAYVSPLFLPDAGPCLNCLLCHFRRLSPAPELYDLLADHARAGRPIAATPFPEPAAALVRDLLVWKASLTSQLEAPAALYRLHVVEVASLEVTSHRVFVDPECVECGRSP